MTKWLLFLIIIFSFSFSEARKIMGKHRLSTGVMVLASSTSQGGQGPQGSTVLTHSEYMYNFGWWNFGMFYQYDKQGTVQQDTAFGPKLDVQFGPLFLEVGYMAIMYRSYTDRSVADETGDGYFAGAGVRFRLSKNWFFQGSYKYRVQNIKEQDGLKLSENIEQIDGYPLAGVGLNF